MIPNKYVEIKQCPFCQSNNLRKHQKRADDIWVLLCQDCDLGFVEKYPENLQELYSLDYYEKRGIQNPLIGYTNYKEIKYDYFLWSIALVGITGKKGSLFDLGASNGLFLDLAKSYGLFPLAGIELNQEYAEICRQKGYSVSSEDFVTFSIKEDEKYDFFTAWAVLEHIPELTLTLDKIKSLLNKDSWFFCEVPCLTFTPRDVYWYNSSLEHIYYFTETSINNILNKYFKDSFCGKIVSIQNFGATYLGIVNYQAKDTSILDIFKAIFDKNISQLKQKIIFNEQNLHILIFLLRYLEDFDFAAQLINSLNDNNQKKLDLSSYYFNYLMSNYLTSYQDNLSYLEAKTYFLETVENWQKQHTYLQEHYTHLQEQYTHLQEKNTAIQSSKFWKIRQQWFTFRRKLGINDNLSITPKLLIKRVIQKILTKFNIQTNKVIVKQKIWDSNKPLVSVIIPCFNYGKYVEEAIDSVLNQTFQDFEIIVVDGGSTDETTIATLKCLKKPKTTIYYREGSHLVGDNRNFGIAKAKGKYICCLDADDKIKSTYLEKALFLLETYHYDVVGTSVQCFGHSNKIWHTMANPTLKELVRANHISTVALFSKKMWEIANGYHDYGIGKDYISEDWDLWVRMMAKGARVMNITEPLMLYRVRGKDTSLSSHSESRSLIEQVKVIASFNQQYLTKDSYKISDKINQTEYQVINNKINLINSYLQKSPKHDQKKILFALPFVITGGADTILLQVAQYLSENGFDISVMTTIETDANKFGDNTLKYEKITKEIYHLYNFLESSKNQWRDFIYYYLESRQIDILFIVGSAYFYDLLPDIKRDFPNLKIIDQLFNEYGHIENNRKHSNLIDLNIVANQVIENILIHKYQESREKISVIVHGVDTKNEFNPNNINETVIQNVIPHDKFIISYMGRFSEEKCPLKFVEMVEQLRNREDLFFLMIGNGPEYESVKITIANLGLEDKIYLPGFVEDNKPFLKSTDVLIIPSRIEGIPIILMESLSLGVPVIASQIGGIPDIITNEVNGFVCNPNKTDDFVERILQIYSDQNLYQQLKVNARNYAVEKLDFNRMNREYLNNFLALVN